MDKKLTIGILTEEPNNPDVALKFKEAGDELGFNVVIIEPKDCSILNFSEPKLTHKGQPLEGIDAVIVRGSLDFAGFKSTIVEYFERLGTVTVNKSSTIKICQDKFATQTVMNSIGVAVPKSVYLIDIEHLQQAVDSLGSDYPIIVKTVSGSHGVGVIKVDTYESLKSIVQLLLQMKEQIMIQEFIDHKESGRIMTLGDKTIAAVMRTIPENDFRSNMDQGAELKPHQPSDVEIDTCMKIAKAIDCEFCAVDYIVDKDGRVVVFEANSSPGLKGIQSVNKDLDVAKIVLEHVASLVNTPHEAKAIEVSKAAENEEETHECNCAKEVKPAEQSQEEAEEDEVGFEETIVLKRFADGEVLAKIDTGADTCSIHGYVESVNNGIVTFVRGDWIYKAPLERMVTIKSANGSEERPIVKLAISFRNQDYQDVEFTISDRSDMEYKALIGRNFLEANNLVVKP